MKRIIGFLMLWLLCGLVLAGVPERPRFRVVGMGQGLPSSDIKALVHDQQGYVWVGTADGLARYDSAGMRVWRYQPGQGSGLLGNNVQALLVDAHNRLWVAVEGEGVSVLDASRQSFSHYRKDSHPALKSDDVWAMAKHQDAVWLGTFGGGLTRVASDGQMRAFDQNNSALPSDTVLSLAVDADDTLWVGTTAGLARWTGEHFEPVALPGANSSTLIYSITLQQGQLWLGSAAGVWRLVDGQWSQPVWSPMFARPNAMLAIAVDAQGGHWIGSQRGLWYQQGALPAVPVVLDRMHSPRSISTLLLERDTALWVPILGSGLGYLRSDWRQLALFQGLEDGLSDAVYRALGDAQDGGVWLGGMSGVIEHMNLQGQITQFDEDIRQRLQSVKPVAIAEDRIRQVWIGHRGGLLRIRHDGAVDEWGADDPSAPVPAGQVAWVLHAGDGSQWIAAAGGGVQQRDPINGRIVLDLPAGEASGLGDADIEAMVLSPTDDPWIAGSQGVLVFDRENKRFTPVPEMGSERVHAFAFEDAETLWLQRLSGLEQFQYNGQAWHRTAHVGYAQGMPAVAASSLVVDQAGRVWLPTPRGLFRWDPQRQNVRHVGLQDAANGDEYLRNAVLLRQDGVLVAAAADGGLRLVDTAMKDAASFRPSLLFDAFAVRRQGYWQTLPLNDALQLQQQDREWRIRARLLSFDDPAGNRYWSRLEGFDSTWVALGNSGERIFTGLAPGHYRLRMRAQDAAGNAAAEQVLIFDVPPPWWRSAWALLLYFLSATLVLAWLAHLYRARLKRRHAWQLAEHKRELAEQASEAKSRFLATLGHEVRTPMTGVLGMAELLQASRLDTKQRNYVDAIRRAGEHLLRLVNDALDLARIEAGKLSLVHAAFSLPRLLSDVASLMAPVAEKKGLVFVEHLASDVPGMLLGDRTRVQQILLNLIGNAVKFTETGHVALETVALQPQGIRLIVSDTGPGLNTEEKDRLFRRFEQAEGGRTAARYGGSGLGLAISQELAAAMGGSITVESELGKGSRFVVDLPLQAAPEARQQTDAVASHQSRGRADNMTLLLVEDDPIVAAVITDLLREQGHVVTHAGHGLAALTEVALQVFDAVLMDLDLPGMDGLALARVLRDQGLKLPLLAVTARSDAEAEIQAKAAGFDGFLRKPVSGAMLAQALQQLPAPITHT